MASRVKHRANPTSSGETFTQTSFKAIARRFPSLQIGVLGDFCLDRYLEIDPARTDLSLETGLEVYNVTNVRCQAGAAGTVLNNLAALGIGKLFPIGFCGADGEAYELLRALNRLKGVRLDHFRGSSHRHTFTYTKPLLMRKGKAPRELNRFDIKNWTETPGALQEWLAESILELGPRLDALVIVDQAPVFGTGSITKRTLLALEQLRQRFPDKIVIADSRANLRRFPPMLLKMNRRELGEHLRVKGKLSLADVKTLAGTLAHKNKQPVIITLAEKGLFAVAPGEPPFHCP